MLETMQSTRTITPGAAVLFPLYPAPCKMTLSSNCRLQLLTKERRSRCPRQCHHI